MKLENNVESVSIVDEKTQTQEAAKVENDNSNSLNANSTIQGLEIRKLVSAQVLLDAGIQIGLSTKRWNPKMKPFIYKKRVNPYNKNANYVIDLTKIVVFLNQAYKFLSHVAKNGGSVLFVCTKKNTIIKDLIKEEARRTQSHFVTQRWLGGTLTNFRTLSNSIRRLNEIVALQKFGEIDKYTKKEQIEILKETERLNKFVGGIRMMNTLPQVLVVIDPVSDQNAIKEAKAMNIPVVALANTNADPTNIDFIIPCNNMSIRSLTLIVTLLADAIAEARNEETKFVGKEDNEIVLPEIQKRTNHENMISHKNFSKNTMNNKTTEKDSLESSEVNNKDLEDNTSNN